MTLAGTPAATDPEGMSLVTTLPAPITTSLPMLTPATEDVKQVETRFVRRSV